jgi:hypothetical protein
MILIFAKKSLINRKLIFIHVSDFAVGILIPTVLRIILRLKRTYSPMNRQNPTRKRNESFFSGTKRRVINDFLSPNITTNDTLYYLLPRVLILEIKLKINMIIIDLNEKN